MKPSRPAIQFFTDNDVPDRVGKALETSGHSVVRLRDVMLVDSRDQVVAVACREHGLVLVTHNVKDFRSIAQRYEHKHKKPDPLCRIDSIARRSSRLCEFRRQ